TFAQSTAGLARACRAVLRHSTVRQPDWRRATTRILACCGQMVIAGGLERQTFHALGAVRERGALVHCLVNDWENFRITPLAEARGATWSVGPDRHPIARRAVTPAGLGRMIVEVARVSRHLWRESRRLRPTHVFVPEYKSALRAAPILLWLRACGVRVVTRLA